MSAPRVIIVTGANRGIGRAICETILSRSHPAPLTLFATSRKGEDIAFPNQNGESTVVHAKLDIASRDSIRAFHDVIENRGGHRVDALVNNAGINLDREYNAHNAKTTIDVNFRGTLRMCQTFLPRLSQTGRIVNLASVASQLNIYSPEVRARFRTAKTLEELERIAQDFETAARDGTEAANGFGAPGRSYSVSKALLRAATAILSRHFRLGHPESQALINCCCPGWVATDMGSSIASQKRKPPKTPEQGARIPVRLALDDVDNVTGEYFANDSVRSNGLGKVQAFG